MIRSALYPTLLTTLLAATLLLLTAGCSTPAAQDDATAANGDATGDAAAPAASPPAAPPPPRDPDPTAGAEPIMCTQIGCNDGLTVELDGFDEELEVELAAADGEARKVTCTPPGPCQHFVPDFTPDEVTLSTTLGGRPVERTFTPDYREVRPNGPDCPPVCRQAQVRWRP